MLGRVKSEIARLLPVVGFFFVALNVVALCHGLMSRNYTKWSVGFAIATGLSLAVGKAMLIADKLPFVEMFRHKPLMYPTAWKAGIYTAASVVLWYAELVIESAVRHHSLILGNHYVISEVNWPRFWAVQIILATFLVAYAGISQLSRSLGPGKLREMFFGRRE
jgi:hypothetical protein